MTSPLAAAEAGRAHQNQIRTDLLREVARLWPLLDPKRLTDTFPGWLSAMRTVVTARHGESAQMAGATYRTVRAAAGVSGAAAVKTAPTPAEDWVSRALGYAGPGLLTRGAERAAFVAVAGTADRIALDGGRRTMTDTLRADRHALGYYRMTRPRCCYFCAMLASRGAVYKRDSFSHSDPRFTGGGQIKVHNHCSCFPVPVFDRGTELPGTVGQFRSLWNDSTGGYRSRDAVKAFRRAYENQPSAA